jgi:hypothetical protein
MRLFPIKISYEIDVITLVTFVISITSLGWQISNYMKGADVMLIAPDQITISSSERAEFPLRSGGPYVHFIIRMSYVNKGAVGYNATVKTERLRFTIGRGTPFEHRWYRFVTHDAAGPDGWQLKVDKKSDASPFPITAGVSESHETLFQPWARKCADLVPHCSTRENYLTWDSFIKLLAANANYTIELEILADLYDRPEPISVKCRVKVEKFDDLKTHGWGSPVCS